MPVDWESVFGAVPRAAFLPEVMWPFDMDTARSTAVSKAVDPASWQRYAASDVPIVTQWDDGNHEGTNPGAVATSSASMPSVVLRMLRELDVCPGQRALEIGTGTGWNAALLAHRLGAENVVTVEVDATVADAARTALVRFGTHVRVVHGDGLIGCPDAAPYDRIVATCGLRSVPYAWVEQCRPGGVIVAPWGTHFGNADAVVRLVVAEDGRSASGRFTGPVEFMKLRAQRPPAVEHSAYVPNGVGEAAESVSTVPEDHFVADRFSPQHLAMGAQLLDSVHVVADKREGARPVWFYGLGDRSWACVMFRDGDTARVWQSGPRRLWDEAYAALRWWEGHDRPGFDRFGLTVDRDGERVWLDTPDQLVRPAG